MSESAGKFRKKYVDHPKDRFKLICLIHGPGYSSEKFKVMGDLGFKYYIGRPTKDHRQEPAAKKKFSRQKENNAIFQNIVYEIIQQENKKLSAECEAHKNIDSKIDKNDIYDIDNMTLDEKKE